MSWHASALCRGATALFHDPDRTGEAKAVCAHCPVAESCLADALRAGADALGVQGGTTFEERRALVVMASAPVRDRNERARAALSMRSQGMEVRTIADNLGVDPKSVYRYLRHPESVAS